MEARSALAAISGPRMLGLAFVYFGPGRLPYVRRLDTAVCEELRHVQYAGGLLNARTATFAIVGTYLWARHSVRTRERPMHVIHTLLVAAAGLHLARLASDVIAAPILVNAGITSARPPLWSLPSLSLSPRTAANRPRPE